jgi:uncharacterized repeat protein (TIGR01451 family)
VLVTDAQVSDLACLPSNPVASLAPGASITCTATHTVTQADLDNGDVFNTACVDDGEGGAEEACDTVTTPPDKNPSLDIVKTDDGDTYDSVGDVIDYDIVATNDGNVTLTGVTVTDPNAANLVCVPANGSNLAPGASMVCTASHTVTQADLDAGEYFNAACVDDGEGGADEDCDNVTTPGDPNPLLTISKEANVSTYDSVGDVISYTIVATNDGNVTLHNVLVTDVQVSDLACLPSNPVASLAPGASINCTASHTVTQADIDAGNVYNQACVDDGDAGADGACDDITTDSDQDPRLEITKDTSFVGKFENLGDVISYTIVATNSGNVTLHDVVVTDAQVTDLVCTPTTPVDLAPGDSINCTASHTITQADLDAGTFYNQACVDDGAEGAAEACDDVTTPGKAQPTIDTDDYLIPQDSVDIDGLTAGPNDGDLYIELRIDETCGQDGTPAWSHTWENVENGTFNTEDLTGADAQTVSVAEDATIRWCTSYSGDANNAARPLNDRGEVVKVDFNPFASAAFGASIPLLAWFLWSRRRRENA